MDVDGGGNLGVGVGIMGAKLICNWCRKTIEGTGAEHIVCKMIWADRSKNYPPNYHKEGKYLVHNSGDAVFKVRKLTKEELK